MGREERAFVARKMLEFFPLVVQITLNIPGLPKIVKNSEAALLFAESELHRTLSPCAVLRVTNGAGYGIFFVLGESDPLAVKKICVQLEEKDERGRVFDIDVLTRAGTISREAIGMRPRLCLLCDCDAKSCARRGAHSIGDLRREASRLLSGFEI